MPGRTIAGDGIVADSQRREIEPGPLPPVCYNCGSLPEFLPLSRQSLLLKTEPSFHAPATKLESLHGTALISWLTEKGSLTRRLRNLAGPDFRVQVLQEDWVKPFASEARLLRLRTARSAWVREVMLLAGERPLVLARSIIPHQTLLGRHSPLARLGQRPLGEWLFAHPGLRRLSLEFTQVKPDMWCSTAPAIPFQETIIWGRRSHYRVARHPLLVCEFFLPELFQLESDVLGSAGP